MRKRMTDHDLARAANLYGGQGRRPEDVAADGLTFLYLVLILLAGVGVFALLAAILGGK